jgi:hypothetical protein
MPARATDPMGLVDSMSTYAMRFPIPFLFLLEDLGAIRWTAQYVATAVAAYPISQVISNADDSATTGTVSISTTDTCTRRERRPERTYYRGLSVDDVRELTLFGQVYSKFARNGLGGFVEALEFFVAGMRNHPASSDVIDWERMVPSPFVSTSANIETARQFANEGPTPGHAVTSFTTSRVGIGPTPGFGEGEYLFFYLLGEPGERLEWVP